MLPKTQLKNDQKRHEKTLYGLCERIFTGYGSPFKRQNKHDIRQHNNGPNTPCVPSGTVADIYIQVLLQVDKKWSAKPSLLQAPSYFMGAIGAHGPHGDHGTSCNLLRAPSYFMQHHFPRLFLGQAES